MDLDSKNCDYCISQKQFLKLIKARPFKGCMMLVVKPLACFLLIQIPLSYNAYCFSHVKAVSLK